MSGRLSEEKVFKDPVHNYIYVQDETIWELINSAEFQRLRRIRQLGTSYLTFHGAEHSRFSHSLGVYEITRRIISQFEKSGFSDWPREERLLCLCAALLHDLGHGPFSHSIENAFDSDHEEWTCRIVLGDTQVNRILRMADPQLPEKIAAVIQKAYDQKIVVSLISSQMDADRMDYLLRDAYYTGVDYGTFDLERILRMVRPHKGHIVVKESGMHAVEDYLMSRYQMYWQVYFHPVTRSGEILLSKIFERARALYGGGHTFAFLNDTLSRLFDHTMTVDDYLQLDEALMQMVFMQWTKDSDPILSDLCARFLNRRLFKYVPLEKNEIPLTREVRECLKRVGLDPEYYMVIDFPADLPYDVYKPGEVEEKLPILLLDARDHLFEISSRSEIVRSISGIRQGQHHVYFPEELLAAESMPEELWRLLQKRS
ncbi:MAG: YwfO [Paenibacillaceae bacterium]|jgi:HD superfamily phosphohydrolase|nr:YwfO [Paenibacillaceae bacterium]